MKKILLFFLLLCLLHPAFAQRKRMPFTRFIAEIQEKNDNLYKLNDAEIIADEAYIPEFRDIRQPNLTQKMEITIIWKKIVLENVIFTGRGIIFNNFIFTQTFNIQAASAGRIFFINCTFKENIGFSDYERLDFVKCSFEKNVFLNGRKRTSISQCTFKSTTSSHINFQSTLPEHTVLFDNNKVYSSGERSEVGFFLRFSEISIRNNEFNVPVNFRYIFVSDKFLSRNNRFEKHVIFATPKFPTENTSVSWSDLSGKIAVLKDTSNRTFKETVFHIDTGDLLTNDSDYEELIAVYSKFLQVFRFRSNSDAYNACYIEMKDIMTRKAVLAYKQKPGLRNYLDWKIKLFLKEFSDYGTDYTKSIIYALKVIIWFALVFFLFPSEKDNLSRDRFFPFFQKSIEYFKTDKPLLQLYEDQKEKEIQALNHFREILLSSRKAIPASIVLFAQPVYKFDLVVNAFSLWILHNLDFVGGKWENLSKKRKLLLGAGVALFFAGYLLWGILIRALNAFALSLNSLTTLGYGGISAQGIARYLVVVEGLVGWFLMTIFSVSLIGQIL